MSRQNREPVTTRDIVRNEIAKHIRKLEHANIALAQRERDWHAFAAKLHASGIEYDECYAKTLSFVFRNEDSAASRNQRNENMRKEWQNILDNYPDW